MEECKCSKILPCYTDGYGVWHYSDGTHEKVYGVNKHMCDIGKTILTKKKNDMEEKKTIEDGFSYDKVVELAKPLMTYLNEFECRDSIRVSQFGIVHEPMSTLIFDNGIGE